MTLQPSGYSQRARSFARVAIGASSRRRPPPLPELPLPLLPQLPILVITSYSIHYTKLYEQASELLRALAQALSLNSIDQEIDAAVFGFLDSIEGAKARGVFLSDYVGFSLYDVLLFSPRAEARNNFV